jgi:hypothetical protein
VNLGVLEHVVLRDEMLYRLHETRGPVLDVRVE